MSSDDRLRAHPTCRGVRAPLACTRGVRYQTLPRHRILASPAVAASAIAPSNTASISSPTSLSMTKINVEQLFLMPDTKENASSNGCQPQQMLQADKVMRLSTSQQLGVATLANDAVRRTRVELQRTPAAVATGDAHPRNAVMPKTTAFSVSTPRQSNTDSFASAGKAARACSVEPRRVVSTSPRRRCRTGPQIPVAATVTGVQSTRHHLDAGEVYFTGATPDLTQPHMLEQLLGSVGATSGTVEKLTGFQGGLNNGIWILHEASSTDRPPQDWVLKVVTATKKASSLPTEAQNLLRLASEHPGMLSDPLLAFPKAILSCVGVARGKKHDVLVMRKARGERLCEVFARKWHAGQRGVCWRIIEKVGVATASIHRRYANMQHGDLQPANIFWDESSDSITVLDVGGMGIATCDDDVQHFTQALLLLATSYGSDFERDGIIAFQRGYHAGCH